MCRAGKTHKHKNIITVLTKTATQETINCSIPEEIQVKKKETRQTLFIDWIFSLCKVLGRNIAEHNSSVLVLFKSHQKLFTWMMIRHQKPSSSLRTEDYHILFEQIPSSISVFMIVYVVLVIHNRDFSTSLQKYIKQMQQIIHKNSSHLHFQRFRIKLELAKRKKKKEKELSISWKINPKNIPLNSSWSAYMQW